MTRPLAVLRPEPGNAATVARARARGLATVALPLFEVRPLAWPPVDPAAHDAVLITSANAIRHGGAGLKALRGLPVFAVGTATADAATAAGFDVKASGDRDAAAILAAVQAMGFTRLLHLGGRDRAIGGADSISMTIPVYASEPLPVPHAALERLHGSIALVHSARAAARLVALLDAAEIPALEIGLAALSSAVLAAAGSGWAAAATAVTPSDDALLDVAQALFD